MALGATVVQTEAEKVKHPAGLRQLPRTRERMTGQEIRAVVDKLVRSSTPTHRTGLSECSRRAG